MTRARIIHRRKLDPSGNEHRWYEYETLHGERWHRSTERTFSTSEEARTHLTSSRFEVDDWIEEE